MMLRKLREVLYKGTDEYSWDYAKMAFKDHFLYIAAVFFVGRVVLSLGLGRFRRTLLRGLG